MPAYTPGILHQDTVVHYIFAASLTAIVWDRMITFDKEVKNIWTLPLGFPKIFFFLNGYCTPGFLLFAVIVTSSKNWSAEFCRAFADWQAFPTRLPLIVAQGLMVTRLSAIYGSKTSWTVSFYALWIVASAVLLTLTSLATVGTDSMANPPEASFLPGCAVRVKITNVRDYAIGTWATPALFELILVILTFRKITFRVKPDTKKSLVNTMARDSLIYFVLTFIFSFANMMKYVMSFSVNATILAGVSTAVACISVSRMTMNIGSFSMHPNEEEEPAPPQSALEFKRPAHPPGGISQDTTTMGDISEVSRNV